MYTTIESATPSGEEFIPWSLVRRGLGGVAIALNQPSDWTHRIEEAMSSISNGKKEADTSDNADLLALTLHRWHALISATALEDVLRHSANIAVSLAFLIHSGRQNIAVHASNLDFVWDLIRDALAHPAVTSTVSRSAQGFLAVPLWSVIKGGNIEELFRLHVWLPDGQRGVPDLSTHAHQPFAQSWILAGEGKDHTFQIDDASADGEKKVTHAVFSLSWTQKDDKDKGSDKAYKTHQHSSTIVNTGKLVTLVQKTVGVHSRNMNYTVPSGVVHKSEVAPDILHATLFLFDSHRGFQQDAPVLGPIEKKSHTQYREVANTTAGILVATVEAIRTWENHYNRGIQHEYKGQWEEALREFRSAVHISTIPQELSNAFYYKWTAQGHIGYAYRMWGRYKMAAETLENVISEMPLSASRVYSTGELVVVYRHMNRLDDAKRACQSVYDAAEQLGLEKETCRAVGNLGMINYQLFLQSRKIELLDLAIAQQEGRVQRARQLKEVTAMKLADVTQRAQMLSTACVWEAIGLARLSLCYTERGDMEEAVRVAREALTLTSTQDDPPKIAISRFFYGRVLLHMGKQEEALVHFNPGPNICTPIIALCKEPSDENRGYIQEMIDAGADLELRDEQGYSALECAVYSDDTATKEVIMKGLRRQLMPGTEQMLELRLYEALLRKHYRELLQDKLRPVLLQAAGSDPETAASRLAKLRDVYSEALAQDEEKSQLFDQLQYIRFKDFLQCGRLPRSSDGLIRRTRLDAKKNDAFIIFFSYRWIAKEAGAQPQSDSPDDIHSSQYKRMVRAVNELLALHPEIEKESVCIWLDFACVNQDDTKSGVAALPMNLAQCNAVISLVDDKYYERSWCCVEVMMIQALRKAYGIHLWYEDVSAEGLQSCLRPGPSDLRIDIKNTNVTFENDRPILLFLERQAKLLS